MASINSELNVRAFARGLAVIQAMGRGPARQSIAQVAAGCGMPRSVVRRLLMTLVGLQFTRTDGKNFWLTPRVLQLGLSYLYALPFWQQAQLALEELRVECGESCSMAVLDADDIVYVVRVPARRILAINLTVGSRIPAHAVSLGRVLLGGLESGDVASHLLLSGRDLGRELLDASAHAREAERDGIELLRIECRRRGSDRGGSGRRRGAPTAALTIR